MYLHPGPKALKFAEEHGEDARGCHNTDAHLRSSIIGRNVTIVMEDGELDLGEFGRIHFIDWDQTREILLVEYPEEVPHETAEDFNELSWKRILDNVFADDPEKGMEMWRRLLDIAEPSLKTETQENKASKSETQDGEMSELQAEDAAELEKRHRFFNIIEKVRMQI